MAASEITVQVATPAGLEATFEAANADGNSFENDGKTLLRVKNGSGSDIVATIDSPVECNQGYSHDEEVTVTAGEERDIGPFPISRFGSTVNLTYDDVTTVTVAAIKVA